MAEEGHRFLGTHRCRKRFQTGSCSTVVFPGEDHVNVWKLLEDRWK